MFRLVPGLWPGVLQISNLEHQNSWDLSAQAQHRRIEEASSIAVEGEHGERGGVHAPAAEKAAQRYCCRTAAMPLAARTLAASEV